MKKIYLFLITIMTSFLFMTSVNAASATLSVKSSSSKVVVGNTVKVTVKLSSASALGAWEYSLNYDKSTMSYVSSDKGLHHADVGNGSIKSVTYTYTFKAIKSGTAKFYVSSTEVIDWAAGNPMTLSTSQASVKIVTQAELEASYSKDNYLKSLSVDGYELTPSFNKDTLEYSLELEPDITSIKINATKNDSKASLSGTGELSVTEGLNKLNIVVTAENGSTRTYVINATVKELSPIVVNFNGKEYNVIRNYEDVTIPDGFQEKLITINNEEVTAYYNEITEYTLVGLKDGDGKVVLYLYDEDTKEFSEYIEIYFASLNIRILPLKEVLSGYTKESLVINGVNVEALKKSDDSTYYLIYGVNIENNHEGFYVYESSDNTIQRYSDDSITPLNQNDSDIYLMIIGILAFTNLLMLIIYMNSRKKKKTLKKHKAKEVVAENTSIEEQKAESDEDIHEKEKKPKSKSKKSSKST